MKKKIFIIIVALIVIVIVILGIRYFQYREILGEWLLVNNIENVENDLYGNYKFTFLGKFTHGKIENRKCGLYGCSGYEDGTYKIRKENGKKIIKMWLDKHSTYSMEYEIIKENNNIYLVTTQRSIYAEQTKYSKK